MKISCHENLLPENVPSGTVSVEYEEVEKIQCKETRKIQVDDEKTSLH